MGRFTTLPQAAVLALALFAGGCQLLKPAEAPRETFEFATPSFGGSFPGGTGAQLLIKPPNALKAVDSDRIIVRPSPGVITYLGGAQWADSVPRLVQAKLVEAFENTRSVGATAKPGDGLVIDYQLIPDIRSFEISNGRAVIDISIKLLVDKTGRVASTRIFRTTSAVTGETAQDYVAGFDRAFAQFAREVIRWTFDQT